MESFYNFFMVINELPGVGSIGTYVVSRHFTSHFVLGHFKNLFYLGTCYF